MESKCGHETLAQRSIGSVEFCHDCQIFHVNVDAVTLRFKPEGFRELCRMIAMALSRVDFGPHVQDDAAQPRGGRADVH